MWNGQPHGGVQQPRAVEKYPADAMLGANTAMGSRIHSGSEVEQAMERLGAAVESMSQATSAIYERLARAGVVSDVNSVAADPVATPEVTAALPAGIQALASRIYNITDTLETLRARLVI